MVGPRTIMKLKHCRDIRLKCLISSAEVLTKREKVKSGLGISGNIGHFNIKRTKVEPTNDMCRVCLQEGTVPIFGNDTAKNIADDINTFGGIAIRINDPYPKNICMACLVLLESALLFRKTAQHNDERLKQPRLSIKNEDEHSSNCFAINHDEGSSAIEETVSGICEIIKKPITVSDSEVNESSNNTVVEQDMQLPNYNINRAECTESYKCKKCNLKFNSFQEYSEHRLTDDHENKKDSCPICQKLYPPNYMKKHISQHKQEASYVCDVCGKNFVLQSSFTRHRLTHFHELPFKCSLCPYKGRFADALKMHMRSHTGERPYPCTECSAKFTSKSNLIKHVKTHKSQLDFNCDECPRGFYTKVELEQHIKVTHRGIKDNACRICNKTFAYRNQMMKHERKVHKREKLRSGKMPIYLQIQSVKDQVNVTHL